MLLLVSPAMGVTITAVDEGGGVVRVGYADGAGIRAFALDITVDNGATINSISDYKVGESNATSKGFGIFPGRFRDYVNPTTPNWGDANYNPVAPATDPGAGTGLGTGAITVELGSLYTGPNSPPVEGTLFKLHCTGNGDANLCVAQNATRGNVVKEDASEASVTLPGTGGCLKVMFECFPKTDPNAYSAWVLLDRPLCWCEIRQCHGDADGRGEGKNLNLWVLSNDLTVMLAAWNKTDAQIAGQTSTVGTPPKVVQWACADFDHMGEGKSKNLRVLSGDLAILLANWNKTTVDVNCPWPK
jgi:hypothetical protein